MLHHSPLCFIRGSERVSSRGRFVRSGTWDSWTLLSLSMGDLKAPMLSNATSYEGQDRGPQTDQMSSYPCAQSLMQFMFEQTETLSMAHFQHLVSRSQSDIQI